MDGESSKYRAGVEIKLEKEGGRGAGKNSPMSSKGMRNDAATKFGRLIPIYFESLKNGLDDLKIAPHHSGLQNSLAFLYS